MLEWNKKCVKEMIFFKNFRFLESIQGFFPTLFIIITLNPSLFLTSDLLYILPLFGAIILAHQFVYIINDYYDFPTDSNNPRKIYTKMITQRIRGLFILFIIIINLLTFKIYNDSPLIFLFIFSFFLLGVLYSHPIPHFKSSKFLSFFTHFLYGFLGSSIGFLILKEFNFIEEINYFTFFLTGSIFGLLFLSGNIMSALLDQFIEPNSWIKNPSYSSALQIKYYKFILYTCPILLAIFFLLQLKEKAVFLTPSFLIIFFGLYKTFKRLFLCRRSQKASLFIRDRVRVYYFFFFFFNFFAVLFF